MILALDLGTKTGWALHSSKTTNTASGVQDFSTKRNEGGGMRYLRFKRWLETMKDSLDEVYFEEVRRHAGTQAAHVYGGLMGTLTSWCEENKVPYSSVPVGVIKKSWAGKGNANKDLMIAEAKRRGFDVIDDNQADALALLHCVMGK